MTEHTPGPWEVIPPDADCERWFVARRVGCGDVPPEKFYILSVGSEGRDEADARLIAAAPDLLAGCRAALGAFERNDAIDWDDLAKAIEKAEGR